MDIIELAQEKGLEVKKTASTQGGEYHSPCPSCGGKDRFVLWPNVKGREGILGRYWCRQCNIAGDSLSFLIDLLQYDFRAACARLSYSLPLPSIPRFRQIPAFAPEIATKVPDGWMHRAAEFVKHTHCNLMQSPLLIKELELRGLTADTMIKYQLGYQSQDIWLQRSSWGLDEAESDKKLWLPKGFTIPTICNGLPIKIKVRRDDWHSEDKLPKYIEISGSKKSPSTYGTHKHSIVIVESEYDAILIDQHASNLCSVLALGGASKRPDRETHELLKTASVILLALDFDEAGKKHYHFWRSTYRNLRAWPTPFAKSPADAFKLGLDIRKWIQEGLQHYGYRKDNKESSGIEESDLASIIPKNLTPQG